MPETVIVPSSSVVRGARRAAIIAVIVSLAIAALLGIIALLSGEFGEVQGKVLSTTLTIAAFGTTALCHLAVVTRSVRIVGFLGIAASIGAAFCVLVMVWGSFTEPWMQSVWWWKALGVLTVAAVSLAQANLLLLLAVRPQRLIRIALSVTLASIGVVAAMLALPILTGFDFPGSGADAYWRIFGVVAILDALGTIALPVIGRVLRPSPVPRPDAPAASPGDAPSRSVALALSAELAARVDEASARAGVSREEFALDAIERALDGARS